MLKVIAATDTLKTQREEVTDALEGIVKRIKEGDLSANGFVLGLFDTSDPEALVHSLHYKGRATTVLAMMRISERSLILHMGLK